MRNQRENARERPVSGPVPFERIDPPARQARLAINRQAVWYTWTVETRRLLAGWSPSFARLGPPILVRLRGGRPYDSTFSTRAPGGTAPALAADLRVFAEALRRFPAPSELQLFSGLLDRGFDGDALHVLFALVRDAIVEVDGDDFAALYAPLGTVGRRAGRFPLHADLYRAEMLFNVFDDVAGEAGGASLFLATGTLFEILGSLPALPAGVRRRIASCLEEALESDRFAELFSLLHDRRNPWVRDLEARCRSAQMRIKLGPGQGYLIHDRRWLHGRTAPRRGVSARRVHRLVFTAARAMPNPMR